MSQPTIAQQLRQAVKLVKPELLAQVPNEYNRRQTFNFLRHKATNYDELLEKHRSQYGDVTPPEVKALTQGAADVIVEALRLENTDLLRGKTNTVFAKFARKLAKLLGLGDDDIDLEAIHEATKTLKRSQSMYKSWNERYRRQRDLVLEVVLAYGDTELYEEVQAIYKANSKASLDQLEGQIHNG